MADVAQKAITANAIVNGACIKMPVSPKVGDKHDEINPTNTKAGSTTQMQDRYIARFK